MRERRLVFGEVAELYDRHRPAYPERLIDDLVVMAGLDGSQTVLEVGAGTGKATLMLATRGIPVLAVEPSGEMAAVARRNCAAFGDVEIEQSDFERWDPRGRRFPLLVSAQAWHWVQPAAGYPRARQALAPRGILAAFWNLVAWERSEPDLRAALLDAYRAAPELSTDGPMHPANLATDGADWRGEIAAAAGFTDPEIREYDWDQDYSDDEYIGLLSTTSDIRLMNERPRTALFAAVTAAIEAHGEPMTLPMRTRACLATSVGE
jgi:SAM-dependent methyltransferase